MASKVYKIRNLTQDEHAYLLDLLRLRIIRIERELGPNHKLYHVVQDIHAALAEAEVAATDTAPRRRRGKEKVPANGKG